MNFFTFRWKLTFGQQALQNCLQKILYDGEYQKAIFFEIFFFSFASFYRIFFLLCSIAALGTNGYFYCGCLLYVIVGLQIHILHTVYNAVVKSGKLIAIIHNALVKW